jgi:hypothetical protein
MTTDLDTTTDFKDLSTQLIERHQKTDAPKTEQNEVADNQVKKALQDVKKFTFKKGDQSFELDEDAEFEMMADKKPVKLTLRELKDRAAGDIAVKNRMHSLAEEKKKVQATLKDFAKLAKNDPLGALEYISGQVKDSDSEFEYKNFLNALAEQAEKLGKMDEKELKAYDLEKKLTKAEQDLSLKERENRAVQMKRDLLNEFPEIGDQQFDQMVTAVMDNEELAARIENEDDLMGTVEDLIKETLTQKDIIHLLNDESPEYSTDNDLIFSLSDQLRQNPDLDEEDIRDIIRSVTKGNDRHIAKSVLSQKQRSSPAVDQLKAQGATDFDILKEQLVEYRTKPKR